MVIISIAGRCGPPGPLVGCVPLDNRSYLDASDRQAVQAVASAFSAQGLKVQYFDGSAYLFRHVSSISKVAENGYLEAEAAVNKIQNELVSDFENPTRIVLLAHSHGTVWASLLAWNYPKVKFDYFISLDSVCYWWPQDHMGVIRDYYDPKSLRRPWPLNEDEGRTPCDILQVPGLTSLQDISDVKPNNISYVLEVRSQKPSPLNLNPIFDDDIDYRPSGSRTNIFTIQSTGQNHMDVTNLGGSAMKWVTDSIANLKLPSLLRAQTEIDLEQIVPAPEGWEYAK